MRLTPGQWIALERVLVDACNDGPYPDHIKVELSEGRQKLLREEVLATSHCESCGERFEHIQKGARTCSPTCRVRLWRREKRD